MDKSGPSKVLLLGVAAYALGFHGMENSGSDFALQLAEQSLSQALYEALSYRGYVLPHSCFFVYDFHVAFITVHFPAYARNLGLDPIVGSYYIAIVRLFNIAGSLYSGFFGQRYSK